MRVVLFDAIQEAHVTESLERAFRAAGHEVWSTGRIGHGYRFRHDDDAVRAFEAQIAATQDFRPDWVIVFRPASAPWPVLRLLRTGGARLAVWFSDDPVLFEHSYGPVVDLYDLVMHCGDATVLRFYEDRFGRPTGVNLPFWTDHAAFPRVHGSRPVETDAMFLGNVTGSVRRRRYDMLAAMRSRVRIHGQVGEDPAGLAGGFRDTDAEVVAAASTAATAMSIPQFFADHRGSDTWFPGLAALGSFELPSRVVQYAAMGLPTVSVDPVRRACDALPELAVVPDTDAADAWIQEVLHDGSLPERSERIAERFDRSFSAAARVLAFESLVADDGWRALDAHERATWFLQFDGRTRPDQSRDAPEATRPSVRLSSPAPRRAHVMLLAPTPAPRFTALDVLGNELRARHPDALVAPDAASDSLLTALPGRGRRPFTHRVDVPAVLERVTEEAAPVLVLGEGACLAAEDARRLREADGASILVLRGEVPAWSDLDPYDLIVGAGPTAIARTTLLHAHPRGVVGPGLVESDFLDAVERHPPAPGQLAVGEPDGVVAGWILADGAPHDVLTPAKAAEADTDTLARALRRDTVLLDPLPMGSRRVPSPLSSHALCAAEHVVSPRHRSPSLPPWCADELTVADDAAEARAKLARIRAEPSRAPETRRAHRRALFDAGVQLDAWVARARAESAARGASDTQGTAHDGDPADSSAPATLRPGDAVDVRPGRLVHLDPAWAGLAAPGGSGVRLRLEIAPPGAARTLEAVGPAGRSRAALPAGPGAVDLIVSRADLQSADGVEIRLLADAREPAPSRLRLEVTASAVPDPVPGAGHLTTPLIAVRPRAAERPAPP